MARMRQLRGKACLLSPALADELRRLVRPDGPAPPTSAELRLEYGSLLGWTGGLVVGMVGQLEAAGAGRAMPPVLRSPGS